MHNHHLIERCEKKDEKALTIEAFALVDSGNDFPYACKPNRVGIAGSPLIGELYEVDQDTLDTLDRLER